MQDANVGPIMVAGLLQKETEYGNNGPGKRGNGRPMNAEGIMLEGRCVVNVQVIAVETREVSF